MNTEYDPELDPTPEDGEITVRDELIILAGELESLQAADFNFWRAQRLARLQALITDGVEGDDFVFRPEPPAPEVPEFDGSGFATQLVDGCTAYEPMIATGEKWKNSNDRILEYAAQALLRNRYMLPVALFATDTEFQERYQKNLTCRPHPPFFFGRSGYFNKPVYESFVEGSRWGRPFYTGKDPIADRFMPFAGSQQDDIVATFIEDWDSGAAKERFLRMAANAIAEMDRGNLEKWEGYRPIPPSLRWNRSVELDLARANPDY
jgi:hypothetical protein